MTDSGFSVAGAGDVNGDGIDDLIIGAPDADPGGTTAGESYVVFGTAAGFAASLDLAALDGSNGFRLDGIDDYDHSGFSVAGAGDVNGDGIDDLIIGAPAPIPAAGTPPARATWCSAPPRASRRASISPRSTAATASASTGSTTYDNSGSSVAGAGDVNGDGIDDLIIGAPCADPGGRHTPARATWCSAPPRASRRASISPRSTAATASASTGSTTMTTAASRSRARGTSTATASMT